VLDRHSTIAADNSFLPNYDREPPDELASFLRSLPAHAREPEYLQNDQVLDMELVEQFARKTIIQRFVKLFAGMTRP
jgi:hypothetical protein